MASGARQCEALGDEAWEGTVGCSHAEVPGGQCNSGHELEEGAQMDVPLPM